MALDPTKLVQAKLMATKTPAPVGGNTMDVGMVPPGTKPHGGSPFPVINKAGIVPVNRPAPAPVLSAPGASPYAPPAMPRVDPAAFGRDVVPVDRMQALQAAQQQAGAPPGGPALPPQARADAAKLILANRNNPAALQRMATVGGAALGRGVSAQQDAYAAQQAAMQRAQVAQATARGMADQQDLQQVVDEKALPYLNQRRPGLLGA